ncbi:MAG: hypothetical protein IJZ72_05370 [Oscillospiraceae bacterium]|nr:hypothetical protein [Oscillospiraceae bacterium]
MNKVTDINERTLEKEKRQFIFFCKIAEMLFTFLLACLVVGAIAIVIMTIMRLAGVVDIETTDIYSPQEFVFTAIYYIICCIGWAIIVNFGAKVFKTLKDGETPFRYEVADKIKAAGITCVCMWGFELISEIIRSCLVSLNVFASASMTMEISISSEMLTRGFVITAIAYIFNYGCKLQQESDETL